MSEAPESPSEGCVPDELELQAPRPIVAKAKAAEREIEFIAWSVIARLLKRSDKADSVLSRFMDAVGASSHTPRAGLASHTRAATNDVARTTGLSKHANMRRRAPRLAASASIFPPLRQRRWRSSESRTASDSDVWRYEEAFTARSSPSGR